MTSRSESSTIRQSPSDRKYFTLAQANASLPYVSRIVVDVRKTFAKALKLQERLEHPMPGDNETTELHDEYQRVVDVINRCVEELHEVGVELKDYELGLVNFPALHDDREVYLCWQYGEKKILAWHESNAGANSRHDIASFHESSPS